MEKTFKFFISFMFGEFNKNQEEDPYKILEDKEYTFLSFNQEEIKNTLNNLQEYLNDFYGQSWKQDNYWISLAVRRPIPGYKFNEQEFKKETNIKLLCKYETLWLGGSRYYSFEDFYKSLGYIEELYNVLLKNYKEEN